MPMLELGGVFLKDAIFAFSFDVQIVHQRAACAGRKAMLSKNIVQYVHL